MHRRNIGDEFTSFFIVYLVFLMSFNVMFVNASGQSSPGGVSVENVSPNIKDVVLKSEEGKYNLSLHIVDYNGWEDIKSVYLNIYDRSGDIKNIGAYLQYSIDTENNSKKFLDDFTNLVGEPLKIKDCGVERNRSFTGLESKISMKLIFLFRSVEGQELDLKIYDLHNLTSTMNISLKTQDISRVYLTQYVLVVSFAIAGLFSYKKFHNIEGLELWIDEG